MAWCKAKEHLIYFTTRLQQVHMGLCCMWQAGQPSHIETVYAVLGVAVCECTEVFVRLVMFARHVRIMLWVIGSCHKLDSHPLIMYCIGAVLLVALSMQCCAIPAVQARRTDAL